MKIIVSDLPKEPKDCMFSERTKEGLYVCTLRPYIEKAGCKPKCLCKSVGKCDRLMTMTHATMFM